MVQELLEIFSTLAKNIVVQVTEKRIRTHNHLSS